MRSKCIDSFTRPGQGAACIGVIAANGTRARRCCSHGAVLRQGWHAIDEATENWRAIRYPAAARTDCRTCSASDEAGATNISRHRGEQTIHGGGFRERCDEAGLKHCTAHGLRKAAAVHHALNDATAPQLMAWFGWRTIGEAQRYIEQADRIRLAKSAGARLISRTGIGSPKTPVSQNET